MDIRAAPLAVIVNPNSGAGRQENSASRIEEAMSGAGLKAEIVQLSAGADVAKAVGERVRSGYGAVIAAGGDGTVSAIGAALAGTETALGVIPSGTLNHFARDLNIPADLEGAVRTIAAGRVTQVDVAEVNGRVFLNNSSIGLYPAMVAERERLIEVGLPKKLATLVAGLAALWRFPTGTVRLTIGETGRVIRTPLVFIGNNEYNFSGWEAGSRAHLRDGALQVCVADDPTRAVLLRAALLTLIGRQDAASHLHTTIASSARIRTFRKRVKVALDGEIVRMHSPLEYSIRPAALRVIAEGR